MAARTWFAVLRHRRMFFGLVKRYDLVTFCDTYEDAVGYAYHVMGFDNGEFTVKEVYAGEKAAMTLSLLG